MGMHVRESFNAGDADHPMAKSSALHAQQQERSARKPQSPLQLRYDRAEDVVLGTTEVQFSGGNETTLSRIAQFRRQVLDLHDDHDEPLAQGKFLSSLYGSDLRQHL